MKTIAGIIASLSNRHVDDWNYVRNKVAEEQVKMLPEIAVVEALREYIDAIWSGPIAAEQAWWKVIDSLGKLDKQRESVPRSKVGY